MEPFQYLLMRYVRDRERMEPINAGVILAGEGRLDYRVSPHLAKRADVETEVWRKWKKFFDDEISGTDIPLFVPRHDSPDFLRYLQRLSDGAVMLSGPYLVAVDKAIGFEVLLNNLYDRLVAPPEDTDPKIINRPTARFRSFATVHDFERRGMKKDTYVHAASESLWMAYRQVVNGAVIAIDKVEVRNEAHRTATEIERLPGVRAQLKKFLGASRATGKEHRYCLLVDAMEEPMGGLDLGDFKTMRQRLEENVRAIRDEGGVVLRDTPAVAQFVADLDHRLPQLVVRD